MTQNVSRLIGLTVALSICAALVLAVERLAMRSYLSEGMAQAESSLRLTVNALDGHLQRFEALPELLADYADIRRLVETPDDPEFLARMNSWLKATNAVLQSSEIYIMNLAGDTIAASNYDTPGSFIGQNFNYRPYFTEAAAGGNGQFFALGTTSGVRGYYFASPIRGPDGAVAGVIAFKIGLDRIEADWRNAAYRIIVSDPEGIIFMSTDPGWLYSGLLPLTDDRLARIAAPRRYADAELRELPVAATVEQGMRLVTTMADDGLQHEYLEASQPMSEAGWTVHALLETAYLRGQARLAVAAFVLLLAVAGAVAVLVLQRRARFAERIAMQAAAQAVLERRVQERTADLARVNVQIEAEITERRQTEQELRSTQTDLVQAGKLAALGQMSAALSHEINQPLAAARNYADSAAILIDRGETGKARDNVVQILSLIDRMAAIGKHLRHVARNPNRPLQALDLARMVAEALVIAQTRLDAARASVVVDLPDDLPLVRGGAVRLQQVLVNLLTNAADAGGAQQIDVAGRGDGSHVVLTVRDRGPGVAAAIADRIFDPFFTTKQVGAGLGLGLSISYNIMKDFGGELRVANDPAGGAVFSVHLLVAKTAKVAAE